MLSYQVFAFVVDMVVVCILMGKECEAYEFLIDGCFRFVFSQDVSGCPLGLLTSVGTTQRFDVGTLSD